MKIDSQIEYVAEVDNTWSQEQIKNEPMLFNCTGFAAHSLGGPITKEILRKVPSDWIHDNIVVDSRVHMLMPGWFPCIPGFHHDDVPRSRVDGQPNYVTPEYRSEHLMALIGPDICSTEFALGEANFEIPSQGKIIYKEWHKRVERLCDNGILHRHKVAPGFLIGFNDRSWHQGVKATGNGWRYFIRISRNTDRVKNVTNEIRQQVQVYMEHPMEGW